MIKILLGFITLILFTLSIYVYTNKEQNIKKSISEKNTFSKITKNTDFSKKEKIIKKSIDENITKQTSLENNSKNIFAHESDLMNDDVSYDANKNKNSNELLSNETLLNYEKNIQHRLNTNVPIQIYKEENISNTNYQPSKSISNSKPLTHEEFQKAEENININIIKDTKISYEDKGLNN